MSVPVAVIVPARLASQRFPRKLLHPIRGCPLILWTARRLLAEAGEIPIVYAVADPELREVLEAEGFRAILTDPDHPSGTDRLAEANELVGAERVINVQADEPLIAAGQIRQLDALLLEGAPMATLASPFAAHADPTDPNKVKVVCDARGHALYFSRSLIPFVRNPATSQQRPLWHMGLYGYRADLLRQFASLPKGPLETAEGLEQLRALENGVRIHVGVTDQHHLGIDAPADAEAFEAYLAATEAGPVRGSPGEGR